MKKAENLVEKIINRHLFERNGDEVSVVVDQTLTQDATGTMAYLEFESLGIPKVRTGLSVRR